MEQKLIQEPRLTLEPIQSDQISPFIKEKKAKKKNGKKIKIFQKNQVCHSINSRIKTQHAHV